MGRPRKNVPANNEYEVERIVDKRTRRRKIEYQVKWVGYPESENTWQTVDSMNCPKLIAEYEEGEAEETDASNESNETYETYETDGTDETEEIKTKRSGRTTSPKQRRVGALIKIQPEGDYKPGDWEDEVLQVDNVTRNGSGGLNIHIQWVDGEYTEELAVEANVRCPQKVISFYESRLKFRRTI
ncbi:hypothetical protein PSACC_03623 [Paramicrosporidium saccamoebae]|uniref:Chromo domain-containing protein n=1 Tax=Paramicrosporidium saccamoebae TaxID=1246581 RepID=A0A2H9TFP4_9FUNG|nr:hypothetical protein PSACC_03623 [Paramicrosporidium saccamoebae]